MRPCRPRPRIPKHPRRRMSGKRRRSRRWWSSRRPSPSRPSRRRPCSRRRCSTRRRSAPAPIRRLWCLRAPSFRPRNRPRRRIHTSGWTRSRSRSIPTNERRAKARGFEACERSAYAEKCALRVRTSRAAEPCRNETRRRKVTGGADTLVQLFTAQAELSRDPSDLSAWHEVAVGLAAAGDAAAGSRALGELGQAAADAALLPLALLAAKELELLDDPASRKLVADLARLYGAGSSRVDPKSRPRPPALPASASAPGPTPPPVPADALPGRDEVLEAARRVAVATAARA